MMLLTLMLRPKNTFLYLEAVIVAFRTKLYYGQKIGKN